MITQINVPACLVGPDITLPGGTLYFSVTDSKNKTRKSMKLAHKNKLKWKNK